MARCPEHGEHKNHETSELSHRYRPNAYESYGSFYNTLSASGTPDGVSESLSDPVGNHVATAEGTSSSNAKLAVVAVAVALFIVFVVLLMRYGYPKAEKKDVPASGICDRESCLEYSQLLRASLADSLNPCHNFYAFVCHGARYPGGTDASILSLTRARLIDAVLEEWLRDNHTLREGRVPGKSLWAGKLLQMCVGQHESGADSSLAELQRFMLERNLTWPHANDSVGLANRDTLGTLVQLSLFWNVDVWFSLRVLEVSASAGRPTFRFGRSESYLEWEEKRKAFLKNNTYNRLLETFISAFGVSEAGHVKNIADRLRALEEEISGILATSPTRVRHSGPRVLKVSEMQPNGSSAHAFDWAAIIAEAFGTGTSEFANDAVVVKNSSLLNGVNTLLQLNANKANIYALVISWTVARDLGSFVHAGLSQAYGMTDRNVAERCILRLDQGVPRGAGCRHRSPGREPLDGQRHQAQGSVQRPPDRAFDETTTCVGPGRRRSRAATSGPRPELLRGVENCCGAHAGAPAGAAQGQPRGAVVPEREAHVRGGARPRGAAPGLPVAAVVRSRPAGGRTVRRHWTAAGARAHVRLPLGAQPRLFRRRQWLGSVAPRDHRGVQGAGGLLPALLRELRDAPRPQADDGDGQRRRRALQRLRLGSRAVRRVRQTLDWRRLVARGRAPSGPGGDGRPQVVLPRVLLDAVPCRRRRRQLGRSGRQGAPRATPGAPVQRAPHAHGGVRQRLQLCSRRRHEPAEEVLVLVKAFNSAMPVS
ncbi:uncharacterized protein [Dermacentor albipictus]|uniref:uncharacterized protein isoform X3 n=1 Tax=Dermacentor albipictus TaxID=60249 RepID=UPI0031FDBF10